MFWDAYIDSVAKVIKNVFPGIKGIDKSGLYRIENFPTVRLGVLKSSGYGSQKTLFCAAL